MGNLGTRASLPALSTSATEVAVVDGETLRVADKIVTLLGVAAPPRGQICRRPDGSPFDCGAASAEALADLVRDRAVDCSLFGDDGEGHVRGICHAAGMELNQEQIAHGWARPTGRAPALDDHPAPTREP